MDPERKERKKNLMHKTSHRNYKLIGRKMNVIHLVRGDFFLCLVKMPNL